MKQFPGITLSGVYYHKETPQDAAAKVEQVMQANPDLTGWAMIGGWPLFTDNALNWQPGTIKCVSVDALPAAARLRSQRTRARAPRAAVLRVGHSVRSSC
jgi:ABC-type sugar transport system substrate-binding protein